MSRRHRWTAIALLASCTLWTALGAAQRADAVASLEARVQLAPDDASLRCQLSFALVGDSRFEDAVAQADAGIAALGAAPPRAARRTLGACQYNRGRAHEGLSHREEAIRAYVESLRWRPNPTVLTRLQSLVPGTPAEFPSAALIALDAGSIAELTDVQVFSERVLGRGAERVAWRLVAISRGTETGHTEALLYAIAQAERLPTMAAQVDVWSSEESGATRFDVGRVSTFRMDAASPFSPASSQVEGLVILASAGGGGACGAMDGFADFTHEVTILLALDRAASRIRSRALVTNEHGCSPPIRMSLRVSGTSVIVSRSSRGALEPGTHPLASLF